MPKAAFTGSRLAYLQGKLGEYALSPAEDRDAYVADVVRWYLKRFPWNLDPAIERTPAELEGVIDDEADQEEVDPEPGAPGSEKTAQAKERRVKYEGKIAEVRTLSK